MSTTSSMLALLLSFLIDRTQSNPIAPAPDGERALVPGTALAPTDTSGPDVRLWAPNTPCNDGTSAEDVVSWVALGDSYASGVTYNNWPNQNLDYDQGDQEAINACRRIGDAYSVQLKNDNDTSWAANKCPYLQFPACSGSRFDAIDGQLNQVNDRYAPRFATLSMGGNDVGFYAVINSCIYHDDLQFDYGPDFPDPNGTCAREVSNAYNAIQSEDESSVTFKDKFVGAFRKIRDYDLFSHNDDFRVFVTGYAQFFNEDDPACDNYSFRPVGGPKITTALRQAMNSLVKTLNQRYSDLVTAENDPKVVFVPIDDGFQGHRFCEPAGSYRDQRINSWFWDLAVFDNYVPNIAQPPLCDPDTDPNCPDVAADNPKYGGPVNVDGSVGGSPSLTRIFHPKRPGHTAMEQALKASIKSGSGLDTSFTTIIEQSKTDKAQLTVELNNSNGQVKEVTGVSVQAEEVGRLRSVVHAVAMDKQMLQQEVQNLTGISKFSRQTTLTSADEFPNRLKLDLNPFASG